MKVCSALLVIGQLRIKISMLNRVTLPGTANIAETGDPRSRQGCGRDHIPVAAVTSSHTPSGCKQLGFLIF